MHTYIQTALDWQEIGTALPFVTIEQATNRVVGSTRFGNIDIRNRRVEIGWTWIGKPWQRTAVNTEAKFLMLQHAFEVWHCIRVELKTDVLERTIARGHSADRRETGRRLPPSHDHRQRPPARHDVLQHHQRRMARSERPVAGETGGTIRLAQCVKRKRRRLRFAFHALRPMSKNDQGIDVSLKRQRYTVIPRTLVFITRDERVLLLRGAPTKRIWANKYNGIGGHIERDEDIYSAACAKSAKRPVWTSKICASSD